MLQMSDDPTRLNQVAHKLDLHIQRFEAFEVRDQMRWSDLISSQETMLASQQRNTVEIEKLVTSTQKLRDSTQDVVEAWRAANGAVKVASAIGKFFKWLSGFGILGLGLLWVYENMLNK
jgi:hypothetical protein